MKHFLLLYGLSVGTFAAFIFPEKTKTESIEAGAEIYQDFCVQCHLPTGVGVSGVFPPLKDSDFLRNNIDISIAGLKYGLKGKIVVNDEEYNGIMASQGLDNEEIADVMNYILNSWGNSYTGQITTEQVELISETILPTE
ncbi:MAG: cytochrome c [Flavobacteriia bacterium]|nr:cytochrome c [Flavobacteriia bacterium]